MANSIVVTLIADLKTTLEAIDGTGVYARTFKTVSIDAEFPSNPRYDMISISSDTEEKSDANASGGTDSIVLIELAYMVRAKDGDRADRWKARHEAAADIEYAIKQDPTRGNVAQKSEVTRVIYFVNENDAAISGGVMTVRIKYRHVWDDPRTSF